MVIARNVVVGRNTPASRLFAGVPSTDVTVTAVLGSSSTGFLEANIVKRARATVVARNCVGNVLAFAGAL
jgi:hypothetical protein